MAGVRTRALCLNIYSVLETQAVTTRLEATATRVEAIASRPEAITIRLEAIAIHES